MTKREKRKKQEIKSYMMSLAIYLITGIVMILLVVTLLTISRGNKEIKQLEIELGVTPYMEEYSTYTEYIPIKETMSNYINTLPIPIEELYMQEEITVDETRTVVQSSDIADLSNKVKEIEPKIKMFNTSAYCNCEECCGKTDGITASGEKVTAWYTIAAGKEYKIGTIIYIPELSNMPNGGWFIVQDRGGAISNDRLDIYLNTHPEAMQYGRKTLECYIYEF